MGCSSPFTFHSLPVPSGFIQDQNPTGTCTKLIIFTSPTGSPTGTKLISPTGSPT
jgi:hypothetical protein